MEAGALSLSLVLVTYHSGSHLPGAVASFREAAAVAGLAAEVIVVDHSEDAGEQRCLAAAEPDHLLAAPNRGYAAGLNRGIARARGKILLLGNPDLRFAPASVGALVGALEAGHDLVGPQFHLGPFLFPPAEEQTPRAALARWRAGRSPAAWRRYLAAQVRWWESVWTSRRPIPAPTLSGALLALRRETAEALGPWDEDYFLYFEETDWLLRARRRGLRLAIAPEARVEHAWGHAAAPGAQGERFARSRRRYFRRHHGWVGRRVAGLQPAPAPIDWTPIHGTSIGAIGSALGELAPILDGRAEPPWSLLTPAPQGFPAAGGRLAAADLEAGVEAFRRASGRQDELRLVVWDSSAARPLGAYLLAPSG